MLRFLTIAAILAAFAFAPALAAGQAPDDNSVSHAGGLTCFNVAPPPARASRCDDLCAAKDAVCVGLKENGVVNPGIGCADSNNPKLYADIVSCRCCAVTR